MNRKKLRLSPREEAVMNAIWDAEAAVTVPELFAAMYPEDKTITVSTINTALKGLISKEMVELAGTKLIGKSRARCLKATVSAEEYALMQYNKLYGKKKGVHGILATLVSSGDDPLFIIDELQKELDEARKKFEDEK